MFLMKLPKMVPFQGTCYFFSYKVEFLQVSTQIRRCTNRCTVCPSDLTFVIPAYSMECVRPVSKMVRIAMEGLIYHLILFNIGASSQKDFEENHKMRHSR